MSERDEAAQPEFSDSAADALFGAGAAAPAPEGALTPEEIAASFPQHEVVRVLGRGGMGMVYLVRHRRHDRLEALKILPPRYGSDPEFAARFEREARALARLNHPNIVAVYDAGQTSEGRLYFTMEYVDGKNLAELIRAGAPLDAVALGEQMCAALAYAHGEGIVHRDIKPANVLVDVQGRVKVADFGLARMVGAEVGATELTSTGVVMGTMGYMAPEQMRGEAVDHRADLFALGAIFYELLCRDRPVGVFDPPSTRIGCDVRWDAIVSRAMQPDPARRYASATEIRAALTTLKTTAAPAVRRTRRPLVLSFVVLAVLAGGGFLAWKKWELRPRPAAFPKPGQWVDATAEFREQVLQKQAGRIEGEWVLVSTPNGYDLAGGRIVRDSAMRMIFTGTASFHMRRSTTPSGNGTRFYQGEVDAWQYAKLAVWDSEQNKTTEFSPIAVPLRPGFDPMVEHELAMVTRGDRITLSVDGRVVIDHRDSALTEGRLGLNLYGFTRKPEFAPRIKKVEYAVLDE